MTFLIGDVVDQLKSSTEIADAFAPNSDAVALGVETMIFGERIPQQIKDYSQALVVQDISNQPEVALGGEVGTHMSVIQLDIWTNGDGGKKHANDLGELIRNRLNGYRGQFGTGVFGTARMVRNSSLAVEPTDGSDKFRRRVSMDFEFIHEASIPTFA